MPDFHGPYDLHDPFSRTVTIYSEENICKVRSTVHGFMLLLLQFWIVVELWRLIVFSKSTSKFIHEYVSVVCNLYSLLGCCVRRVVWRNAVGTFRNGIYAGLAGVQHLPEGIEFLNAPGFDFCLSPTKLSLE